MQPPNLPLGQVIPVANKTPTNKAEGWFYNGQLLRSDTIFGQQIDVLGTGAGSQTDLVPFNTPGGFQWTVDRLIVGAFLDLMLEVTAANGYAEASVYLAHYEADHFIIPSINVGLTGEGGAPGVLIGASLSANHPGTAAAVAVATKTVGTNFYPAPFFVGARSPVKVFHFLNSAVAGGNALYARATVFSIPAN